MHHSIGIDVGKGSWLQASGILMAMWQSQPPFSNDSMGLKKLIVHLKKADIGDSDPILLESTYCTIDGGKDAR